MKIEHEGAEIEVYTADEVAARETAARTAVEGEFKPKLTDAETKLADANKRLSERAGEFAQFRKLNEEQVAKLSVAERTIYENQVAMQQKDEQIAANNKKVYESAVVAAIKGKIGADQALFDKVKGMYDLINLDDATPEGIAARVNAALGAIGGTQPDLLAAAGVSFGSHEPPKPKEQEKATFADSEAGKAGAAELGIMVEAPKK